MSTHKSITQVVDDETGTYKAKELPSKFDHAKKQGGQSVGAAASAAQALGKLVEARKESNSSSVAVEREKVEVMRVVERCRLHRTQPALLQSNLTCGPQTGHHCPWAW